MKHQGQIHVLYLPRWYPSRNDSMLGLFVQNHAKASIAAGYRVTVAYVSKEVSSNGKRFQITENSSNGLTEVVVYYKYGKYIPAFYQLIAWVIAVRRSVKLNGKPDLIHSHVLTRTALLAWVLGLWYKVPFIITEHWSRYFNENLHYKGLLRKTLTRFVINKAAIVTVVSNRLYKAMVSNGLKFEPVILPNVVDTSVFKLSPKTNSKFRFINVSCFENKSKNLKMLIDAADLLWKENQSFELELIGDGADRREVEKYAIEKGIKYPLQFSGTKLQLAVGESMSKSDCLVLSSNYETYGLVVFEALASGIPVITTDVADLKEIITSSYGKVVPVGDILALANAMLEIMDHQHSFDQNKLRELVTTTCSKESVSALLDQLYQRVTR